MKTKTFYLLIAVLLWAPVQTASAEVLCEGPVSPAIIDQVLLKSLTTDPLPLRKAPLAFASAPAK